MADNAPYKALPTEPDAPAPEGERIAPLVVDDGLVKSEHRLGDTVAMYAACIGIALISLVSIALVIFDEPWKLPWVSAHIILNPIALLLIVPAIVVLQPTSQASTKATGLARHQLLALPALAFVTLGTLAIVLHKTLNHKAHFRSWHGTIGIAIYAWLAVQAAFGGATVWFGGAAFGGGLKPKLMWKYHRLSGYILFPLLMVTTALGGASHWAQKLLPASVRLIIYGVGSAVVLAAVMVRVRPSKMKLW
ncbi:unnamed protein product [Peniophora sp. CBMAI 1063]|nr:unnamed protein product [Peniophora sp. CBMAI 1063]